MRVRTLFFLLGFWAILSQIVFLRETLVIFFGNEITIGLFYAVWFAGIFSGAFLGAAVSDRLVRPLSFLTAMLPLFLVFAAGGVTMLRLGRTLAGIPAGQLASFSSMTLILFCSVFPLGFLVGIAYPVACRAALVGGETEAVRAAGFTVGTVYLYESLGSLAAGLLHAFYLVEHFAVFPMLFVVASASLAYLTIVSSASEGRRALSSLSPAIAVFLIAVVGMLTGVDGRIETWSIEKRWNSLAENMRLVQSADSRYQNIAIAEQAGQYSLYLNGHYTESFPDPYGNALLAHFIMCEQPLPKRVLIVGSGITGLLQQVLLHKPERVDYVELDGALVSILTHYLTSEERESLTSPGVHVVREDARHFIKERARDEDFSGYDVVILNLPEPSSALINRYYTVDFFQELSRILSRDGIVVTGLPFTENYIREEVLAYGESVYRSLGTVFPHVIIAPGSRILFFASHARGVLTTDPEVLAARYLSRHIQSAYFSEYYFSMLLLPERVEFVREAFSGPEKVPVNTDANPITYYFGYMLWDRFSGGNLSPVLELVRKIRPYHVLSVLVFVFLLRTGLHRIGREPYGKFRSFCTLFSIFTAGTAGMSVSILLMFSFQNAVGYLYGDIGALVALFMAGLATGGWLLRREVPRTIRDDTMILLESVSFLVILLLVLFIPGLQALRNVSFALLETGFYFLMFICGVYTGAEFPLTSAIYVEEVRKLGRGAGRIDAMDHGGALLGALVTGVLLVPVVGIVTTFLLVAALKGLGLLFWLYARTVRK